MEAEGAGGSWRADRHSTCSSPAVCADNNHVRTWTVTRFRGMISTQPGSTPLASFKILSLEETESHGGSSSGNDIGGCARPEGPWGGGT